MEEVLVFVFQLFFEVAFQLLGSVPLDASLGKKADEGCGWAILHPLTGGLMGTLSAWAAPSLLLPHPWMRLTNLLLAPLVAGWLAYLFARWQRRRGKRVDPSGHFWHGFLFAFMFGAARFAFGRR